MLFISARNEYRGAVRRVLTSLVAISVGAAFSCSGGKAKTDETSAGGNAGGDAGGGTSVGTSNRGGGISVGQGGGTSGSGANASGGASSGSQVPAVCGDGIQSTGEKCDDGNIEPGDGCGADCLSVAEGYVCSVPGKPCVPSQVCGDKRINGTETCDDGNTAPADGCSGTCRVEPGYDCPVVGVRCVAAACGDGILAGKETCDDGQTPPASGDGCSATCVVETPGEKERDGWVCPEPGQPCTRTTCGDGKPEGTEQCDDGNNDSGDGCTPACRKEPSCPVAGGACKSVCGDGMILPSDTDQACDDGNSANGDGCSSTCTIETGFECSDSPVIAKGELILPIVYRDFKGGNNAAQGQHPDFQHSGNSDSGIVQDKLGADGKPVHATVAHPTTTNLDNASTPDWFSLWYRDAVVDLPTAGSPRYNYTFVDTLTLAETGISSGTFQYSNRSFYPLDGRTPSFGNQGNTHNYHFTSEVRYWFQYAGNELLTFSGDDDVWVFVNKQLTVDLGGIHSAIDGSVQLSASDGTASVCEDAAPGCANARTLNLGLELGKVYEIVVFQAERHTSESNYTLSLSAFTRVQSTCRSVCGDGIVTADEACDLGTALNTGAYGTCTADCKLPAYCGDGKVDTAEGEQCDDSVNLATYGYNNTPACAPSCKFTDYCGDTKVDSLFGEQCDDGNHVSGDGCEANCTNRAGCGNGTKDAGEGCDDNNLHSGDGCSEFCQIEVVLQ